MSRMRNYLPCKQCESVLNDTTKCEGLFYTISPYVTPSPFPRITNDVHLDGRQRLNNRVFNGMIPNQSRTIVF